VFHFYPHAPGNVPFGHCHLRLSNRYQREHPDLNWNTTKFPGRMASAARGGRVPHREVISE
jgi:hypothetical protein